MRNAGAASRMWLAPAFRKLGLQVVEVAVPDPFDERFPLGAIVGQDWPVGILGVSDEHSVSASSDADAVAGIALPRDAPRKVPQRRLDRRWHFLVLPISPFWVNQPREPRLPRQAEEASCELRISVIRLVESRGLNAPSRRYSIASRYRSISAGRS